MASWETPITYPELALDSLISIKTACSSSLRGGTVVSGKQGSGVFCYGEYGQSSCRTGHDIRKTVGLGEA